MRLPKDPSFRAWRRSRRFAREFLRSTRDAWREAQRSPEQVGFPLPIVLAGQDTVGPLAAWPVAAGAITRGGLGSGFHSWLILHNFPRFLIQVSNAFYCLVVMLRRTFCRRAATRRLLLWWEVLKKLVNRALQLLYVLVRIF